MKPMFEWCVDCKFFKHCYDWDYEGDTDKVIIRGPNFLEPACGKGPAK